MAILKYLGLCLYAARAAQTNTERTPRVPLVSIRELHEDFSGKVEDAECARKPELVNAHEDVLVVAGECSGYKDFVVAAEMSTAARERGDEPAFPALYDPRFVKSDDTLSWRRRIVSAGGGEGVAVVTGPDPKNCREAWCGGLGVLFIDSVTDKRETTYYFPEGAPDPVAIVVLDMKRKVVGVLEEGYRDRLVVYRDKGDSIIIDDVPRSTLRKTQQLGLDVKAKQLVYDEVASVLFVGGNLKSGERGLTKVDVKQAFEMSVVWTVGIKTSVGTPRLHLRRKPDAKATEVLLLSKYYYARVDASNGNIKHLKETEGLFFPKDTAPAATYDPYRDCLYSTGGSKLRRSDVETGKKVWVVDLNDEAQDSLQRFYPARDTPALDTIGVKIGTDERIHVVGEYFHTALCDASCHEDRMTHVLLTLDDCVDDATWRKRQGGDNKDKPDESADCAWVSSSPSERCASKGFTSNGGHAWAWQVCPATCATCPYVCGGDDDSTEWQGEEGDCQWVADAFYQRSARVGEDGRLAYEACPAATGVCRVSDCDDDALWHKSGEPLKDCQWVGEARLDRCGVKGPDERTRAYERCRRACGTCSDTCEDDDDWRGPDKEKCSYVEEAPYFRCVLTDDNNVPAYRACPEACGSCKEVVECDIGTGEFDWRDLDPTCTHLTGRGTLLITVEPRDSLTVLLENIVQIEGSVHVGYFSMPLYECPDVAPRFEHVHLPKLETIGRDLVIGCTRDLQTFDAPRLAVVGYVLDGTQFTGEIEIFGNSMLASLDLPYLERIDDVSVDDNADLVSINVPRLTDVDRLAITSNKGLASVSFEALERASQLRIADNGLLTTLDGAFPSLQRVELLVIGNRYSTPRDDDDDRPTPKPTPAPTTGASLSTIGPGAFPALISAGSVEIKENSELRTIEGAFPALTSIGDNIEIERNPRLTSIDGFDAVTTLGQRARVWANPQLKAFGGFEALTTFGGSASYNAGVRVFDNRGEKTRVDAFANLESLLDAASVECDPLPPDSALCGAPVFGDETPCFCLESPEDDWRCSVRYSDDDCTPDSDDECGDEDRRI